MYSKGILERYGQAIEDNELRKEFQDRIKRIAFANNNGRKICTDGQVADVLTGSIASPLLKDLRERYTKFLSEEDFKH
jgi:hypothetical protein